MCHSGGAPGLKSVALESPSQKPHFWEFIVFILLSKESDVFLFLMAVALLQQGFDDSLCDNWEELKFCVLFYMC